MSQDSPVNILLVDDQPENLLALEAILGGLGETLVKASSGEEALRCLLHQDFAVILLDVQMPGIDGFDTATLIRNRARSQHTPIIFLTAFSASDHLVFKGYSHGAVDYLLKPIDPAILTSKVSVFVDLFKKSEAIKRQAAQLTAVNAELRQSEERFRSLSACSPSGIFVIDPSGRCTYTNPRFQAICGIRPSESLETGWHRCVHPEDRDHALAQWTQYIEQGGEYSEELRFQAENGEIRWGHVRSSPMLSGYGELIGHVGTIEDITERKQAEETRAQVLREQVARQEAEAANRMKDEFLAVLSHELRTPLNSILGWARLLRAKQYDQRTTVSALETIERNAELQSQLIEDILDVSKIIRGKLQLNCRSIDPLAVIQSALDAVRPQIESKSIHLTTDLNSALGHIWGDSTRLQQIIWNLLTNAVKFTPLNGEITIRLVAEDGDACITITDNGIGISPEFLPSVFDRFRQADSTTTRSHKGLGLGLAIVRHLVELHGGSVAASSPGEGLGATFTVRLPLIKPESSEHIPQTALNQFLPSIRPSHALAHQMILVVDDEADNRNLVSFILKQQGATVATASSAQEALELLDRQTYDLLISDIGMPEIDGYALIQQVRQQGQKLPAIALSAYASDTDHHRMLEAGYQQYLTKPVEPTGLVAAIVACLRRSEGVRETSKKQNSRQFIRQAP